MTLSPRQLVALAVALAAAAGCTDNNADSESSDSANASGQLTVLSTSDECEVSAESAPSGNLVFSIQNDGDQVTEFYLLAEDGERIIGEVENIGPGLSRDLVVRAQPGSYVTACKPGMVGDGIRGEFTVDDSGDDGSPSSDELTELETAATDQYRDYVTQQADLLLAGTKEFAEAYKAGDDDKARALYAPIRVFWESIEPVAESFGDLDPKLDLREADLEEGQEWTGWHRIEKDLWPPAGYVPSTQEERDAVADQLVADTEELVSRIGELEFTADQLGNGAKELLDEVATGKVTGEEEAWSHTDLWDFQANVDGARIAYQALRPIVLVKEPELAETLDARFEELQAELDQYKEGDGFVLYTDLTPEQVKGLADSVNALGEPLSTLTSVVVL